jgi:3-phenylpropionate/cinnamic acid dioxygenase small subunit
MRPSRPNERDMSEVREERCAGATRLVREEVLTILHRYASAVDEKDWSLLDSVFLPFAQIDFRQTGGIAGRYAEVRPWLETTMARYRILQHFISNVRVEVGERGEPGERIVSRAYVHAVHGEKREGRMAFFDLGGEYEDRLVRTEDGLRIAERTLHARFFRGEVPNS